MNVNRRTRRLGAVTLVAGTLGAVALNAAFPAVARGAVAAVTTVSCTATGTNWCISGNDSSSGIGVIGTSKSGTGVRATSSSNFGMKATSSSADAIFAQTTTGAAAISATAQKDGVVGTSTQNGIGLYGSSASGYGVYGTSTSGNGYGFVGVMSGSGTAVYGSSNSGTGVYANSSSGTGLFAIASNAATGAFIEANTGYAIKAQNSGNPTIYASNTNGNGTDITGTYIGLLGRAPASGGFPIVATDSSGNDLFYVDGAGNVNYKGSLTHFASIGHQTAIKSFTPDATEPIVEDTGTARLVNGAAAVRLERTFARSIQADAGYRVFVTPNGDTRGLFVATKTAGGFLIREAQGGRSTVTFDYRIVATAIGRSGQRMTAMDATAAAAAPRALPPLAQPRPAVERLPVLPAP